MVRTLAALLICGALAGQKAHPWGLQAGLAVPARDLRDALGDRRGLGLGAFREQPLWEGAAWRVHGGALAFPDRDGRGARALEAGLDLVQGGPGGEGWFAAVGVTVQRWELRGDAFPGGARSVAKLGPAGAVGYRFGPRWSLEFRDLSAALDRRFSADAWGFAATWRP